VVSFYRLFGQPYVFKDGQQTWPLKKPKSSLEELPLLYIFLKVKSSQVPDGYRVVYLFHKTWHVNKWHASQTQLGHVIDEHIHNLIIKYGWLFVCWSHWDLSQTMTLLIRLLVSLGSPPRVGVHQGDFMIVRTNLGNILNFK